MLIHDWTTKREPGHFMRELTTKASFFGKCPLFVPKKSPLFDPKPENGK